MGPLLRVSQGGSQGVSRGRGLTQGSGSSPELLCLLAEFIYHASRTHGGLLLEGHQKGESLTAGASD